MRWLVLVMLVVVVVVVVAGGKEKSLGEKRNNIPFDGGASSSFPLKFPTSVPDAYLSGFPSQPSSSSSSSSSSPRSSSSSSSSPPRKTSKKRQEDRGERPQLTNNRILPLSATVASEKYDYLLSTLEFDQDVYVNHAFACPGQDQDCSLPSTCVPCDWSGSSPSGCTNPNCCGAAQWPMFPASNHTADWCDNSLPSYTKLDFNVPSETFTLAANEIKYFRFYVGEEQACRSILVQPNINFGDGYLFLSQFVAYPNAQSLAQVENGQSFYAGSMFRAGDDYGAGSLTVCPNNNPVFGPGTYSVSVTGSFRVENTEMSLTIFLGEDRYPIAPPDDRYDCSTFPVEEFDQIPIFAPNEEDIGGYQCIEDGVSLEIIPTGADWYDFVLPVQPGCQEISFVTNGFADPAGLFNAGFYFYCGQSSEFATGGNRAAAISVKKKFFLNELYLSACFDELTYLHCSVFSFVAIPGSKASFLWTTETKPIRYKVSDVPPGQLSSDLGLSIAGGLHPALNYEALTIWGLDGYAWLTQPSNDPLVFYPPYIEFAYNYSEAPIDAYIDAGFSETKSNIVSIVDLTTKQNTVIRDQQTLLEGGFIFILGITSATGMPVELCNDDDFDNGRCQRGNIPVKNSWTDFLATRTYSSMNIVNDPPCDEKLYNRELHLVEGIIAGDSKTLDEIGPKAYLSDLYNSGLARTACVMEIETFLESESDNNTKLEKNYCPYEPLSPEWEADACCQLRLEAIECCAPQFISQEDDLYTEADEKDVEKSCFHSDCDESFFEDIASSLNVIGNPLVGCASGLGNPQYELSVLVEKAMASFYRPCLLEAGYGDLFDGIKCKTDGDCEYLDSTCDVVAGKCRSGPSESMQNKFFECYMENLPPKVEDYIRFEVLPAPDANYPKGSDAFLKAVKEAASVEDCVGREGVGDLEIGERYVTDTALFCKAGALGIPFNLGPVIPYVMATCPGVVCRGERACLFEYVKMCGIDITGWCKGPNRTYVPPSLSFCPLEETICNTEPPTPIPDDPCSGYTCALCLSETSPCTIVEGITTEEECANVIACELPDGSFRYDLSEEQCGEVVGECTADCDGQSCRSLDGTKGVCGVGGVGFECYGVGGFLQDGVCWLLGVQDEGSCAQVGFLLSGTPEWYSCGDMDINSCSNHTAFDFPYLYLKCYVDEFRDCETQEECEDSGTCSDVEYSRNVNQVGSWFSVTYGVCLTSGIGGSTLDKDPFCFHGFGEFDYPFGCLNRYMTSEPECLFWGSPASFLAPHWTYWLKPAKTEETCRQNSMGRFGCYLPKDYQKNYYFWNETACECLQGTSGYFFDWTPGVWRGGKIHSLTWMERETSPKYSWEETLSFVRMEEWVSKAVEVSFVYALKSQLTCEVNYVTSSLSTLVCDCVGNGESCFPNDIEIEVGVSGACADDSSVLKGPSSFTEFDLASISDLCTEVSLYLIKSSWFQFPRASASVSFQFAKRKTGGVVLNEKKATVGEIRGDGSRILFKEPGRVNKFTVCLLVIRPDDDIEEQYPAKDFGVPQNDYSSILPLGLQKIEVREVELYTYWCAEITEDKIWNDGSVTYFPISRLEDYQSEEESSLTHQTESLLYTLAACYLFDLLLLLFFFLIVFKNFHTHNKEVPAVTWLGVIFACVCVFRVVFCFVYIDDGFSELSEYVVFEIPTFLLFSGVILVICLFMRLSKKKGFDFKSQDMKLWILGILALVLVWSLFLIVTVVYSEVILEQTEESECPGRVENSNSEIDDDTRTLSIIYQSIVIFFTLLLALVFLRQSIVLFKMTKKTQKAKVFVFRLGSILVISFLLRCILFLVLLTIDLTSDIYLFITLFLTEVVVMFLIALEVNKSFYKRMMTNVTSTGSIVDRSQVRSTSSSGGS